MTTIALTDNQLRQVMEIAEAIARQLRGDYLEHIAADLVPAAIGTAVSAMVTSIVQQSLRGPWWCRRRGSFQG